MFTPVNKKESALLDAFLTALTTASNIPAELANDALCLLKVLHADTDNVATVKSMIDKLTAVEILVVI